MTTWGQLFTKMIETLDRVSHGDGTVPEAMHDIYLGLNSANIFITRRVAELASNALDQVIVTWQES